MPILAAASEVIHKSFDYIIVGGGTAGLVLATRLSEDPGVTVLVLEAGESHLNDPKVDVPGQYGATFMNPSYDWSFPVMKQKNSNNTEPIWSRGKGLGGSSAMNFMGWMKPPASDIDAFEKLGNPGWNWAEFDKYSKKSETFSPAVKEITDLYPHPFDATLHGASGPIQVTVPIQVHTLDKIFKETFANKGIKPVENPYGGDITGSWISYNSLDNTSWLRSYSANSYLLPNKDRANLTVLTGAIVSRVLFAEAATVDGDLVANGVEFIQKNDRHTVSASREVVLSAGVHAKIGVQTMIDLPGVGENVQEHQYIRITYELDSAVKHHTLDQMLFPAFAAENLKLHAEGKGLNRTGITSVAFIPLSSIGPERASNMIKSLGKEIKILSDEGKINSSLAKQYALQLSTLKDDTLPDMEFLLFPGFFMPSALPAPGKEFITVAASSNHPISRGTIHANSHNPLDNPEIDPNYFGNKFDLQVLVEHFKYIRSMAEVEPFKSSVIQEVFPGPNISSDEDITEFVKNTQGTVYHTVGSCSMLPRNDFGVVDSQLKVYGTKNLRVADISVVPLHIAAHTQSIAYFIGEKAADVIRNANGGRK